MHQLYIHSFEYPWRAIDSIVQRLRCSVAPATQHDVPLGSLRVRDDFLVRLGSGVKRKRAAHHELQRAATQGSKRARDVRPLSRKPISSVQSASTESTAVAAVNTAHASAPLLGITGSRMAASGARDPHPLAIAGYISSCACCNCAGVIFISITPAAVASRLIKSRGLISTGPRDPTMATRPNGLSNVRSLPRLTSAQAARVGGGGARVRRTVNAVGPAAAGSGREDGGRTCEHLDDEVDPAVVGCGRPHLVEVPRLAVVKHRVRPERGHLAAASLRTRRANDAHPSGDG